MFESLTSTSVLLSLALIFSSNILIIQTILSEKSISFLDRLVLLDCLDGLAHIPIILGIFLDANGSSLVCSIEVLYNIFISTINRTIPVLIAIYRYVYVFCSDYIRTEIQKKRFNAILVFILFLLPICDCFIISFHIKNTQRWHKCMDTKQNYSVSFQKVQENHFLQWGIQAVQSFLNFVLVPAAYIRIYIWRQKHKAAGISDFEIHRRRKRNIVSFMFNIIIWIVETIAMIIMIILYSTSSKVMDEEKFLFYIVFTAGALPCLYFLGIRLFRIKLNELKEKLFHNIFLMLNK